MSQVLFLALLRITDNANKTFNINTMIASLLLFILLFEQTCKCAVCENNRHGAGFSTIL